MYLYLRCGKELNNDDSCLLIETTEMCLLSTSVPSPPPIQTYNLSCTHCMWPFYCLTSLLPTTLIYSYHCPLSSLSGVNVSTVTGAEATKDPRASLWAHTAQSSAFCLFVNECMCLCFFMYPYSEKL